LRLREARDKEARSTNELGRSRTAVSGGILALSPVVSKSYLCERALSGTIRTCDPSSS